MTKGELNTHIEKRYSECCKRSQGLSYGSFYDGYVDCYCEQQKQVTELEEKLANADYQLEGRDLKIKELETQIEKMKKQYDYAFSQLCESREIVCSMLSQYKNKKEIDYSTRERGEKLLKQGVYKYD